MQHLGLLIANSVGLKRYRRLHGGETQQLHHVIRNHVPQCPGIVKVSPALFHPDSFRVSDLNMIDIATVPDWLKNSIVELKDQDILYRLLAETMIHAIDLAFGQHPLNMPS